MFCYRFTSEFQFLDLAAAEGLVTEDGTLITGGHGFAIDVIGTIYEGGTYDEQGEVITPPVALDGWHVNAAGIAPEAWDAYLVVVNSAAQIFLGGPTQAPSTDVLEQIAQ
jgi:hypothetical protein